MLSPKHVINIVEDHARYLDHNEVLIDIFEGCLLKYIEKDMSEQFSLQMFHQAMARCVPINILPKIIDKLTNIYNTAVVRQVVDGNKNDAEILSWFADKMSANIILNNSNELFNLCKSSLIHPYIYKGTPYLRVILNDRFVVYSEDTVDPTKPTHVILLAGKKNNKDIYWVYSDDEFMICNSNEEIELEMMEEMGNAQGVNPIGRLPFVYVNESHHRLIPKQDTDILKLTKMVPIMLTDLNVAAMYQSFSIMYGIDLDDENLKMSPNAFWRLKSDPSSDKKPEIGMLKPQVDYEQVLRLIESELSMWLGTKGIRASAVGSLTAENFASGVSKVIDEMDTYEARQAQISYYQKAEAQLWDLVLKYMHPYWVRHSLIENKAVFNPTASVVTDFAVQLPMQSRGQLVKDLRDEFQAGFISRRRAMLKLNPELSSDDIDELIAEIDEERSIAVEDEGEGEDDGSEMAEDRAEDTKGLEAGTEA